MYLKDKKFALLLFSSLFVILLEFLSLYGMHLPEPIAIPLFLCIIFFIGHETLYSGIKAFFQLDFTKITLLMVIATVGAFILGHYEEAAAVIVLYTLAEKLEDLGIAKSKSAFDNLLTRLPKEILVKQLEKKIPIEDVKIGQTVVIKPGEYIPLDGVVTFGSTSIDESTITGEPIPKDKQIGDSVFAGTLNTNGYIELEVTKTSKETTLSKIRELTYNATKTKAKAQLFIEKFAKYYTPFILALAIFLVIIPVVFMKGDFKTWFLEALTLIVISCPCALVISTPVSVYAAIGNASKKGVLIKGGRYLESLGQLKSIAFDKTRTLTFGKPHVTDIIPYNGNSKEELLSCSAGLESFSEHPLSSSIMEAAKTKGYTPHIAENFQNFLGKGAKAECLVCESRHHCIGKLQFILEEHIVPEDVVNEVEKLQNQGKTVIVVSNDKHVKGIIALSDEIRPESFALIRELKAKNIQTVMLTGDNAITATVTAKALGIDQVFDNQLPEDKAQQIENLLNRYKTVAMVGDGINDAPSLALASVGITLGSLGSDTAIDAASMVILNDQLTLILDMLALGKRALKIIRFNTICAIAVKVIFIALALAQMSNLAMAIFADVGVTILVILNSLRLLK